MTEHLVTEFDTFFLSYDEPNADRHWADLTDKAPWAERVHGIKGFAAAHEACALKSQTDWFITVDADNIVLPEFFDQTVVLDAELRPNLSYTWNGVNMINGLQYGNGGIKLWSKSFVLGGGIGHERSTDPAHAVDFCWQDDYVTLPRTFSEVWNNGSAYQAWRVGFREAVKLTLNRGQRVGDREIRHVIHPVNLRNLRIWSCVGADIDFGLMSMWGTRAGLIQMCDPNWDHTVVRDFDWFDAEWAKWEGSLDDKLESALVLEWCRAAGKEIEQRTGIALPVLDPAASEFFRTSFKLRND